MVEGSGLLVREAEEVVVMRQGVLSSRAMLPGREKVRMRQPSV